MSGTFGFLGGNWGQSLNAHEPDLIRFAEDKIKSSSSGYGVPDDPIVAAMAASDRDINMDIEANVRALAPAMQQGATFANTATKYTGYAYGAAAIVASGAPAVASVILRGVGWAQATFGAGTGVLLGRYYNEADNYIIDAKEMGANYFNLGEKGWKVADYFGEPWEANRAFIDTSVARGQQFFLNQAPFGADTLGTYGREVQHLFQSGVPNSQIMVTW
jgi:hypothetical protein